MVEKPAEEVPKEESEEEKKSKKKSKSNYKCKVTCLDGSEVKAEIEKTAKGEELYNKAVQELSITGKEYVGLRFKNEKGTKLWLDIHKDMKHQLGDNLNPIFQFRIKFYEPEPSRIQDIFMRYLLYLQLREDLTEGRLKCHENTYAILGSYTVQAELGDFNLHNHDHDYINGYQFAPEQNSELMQRVHELHKEHRGQSPAQAELNFLEIAKKIPRYGVDIHRGKDSEGDVEIGIAAIGIYVYRYSRKEYLFRWQLVDIVLYNRRKFTVKVKEAVPKADEEGMENPKGKKKQLSHIYYFDSATSCKQCYKSAVEYHTFFRLARPDVPRKKADSLKIGSSFRYSDRTLYQIRHRPADGDTPSEGAEVPFTRTPSKRRSTNTPRGSWNPDDENIKNDKTLDDVLNGSQLRSVDEEPIQYEEIEIDEANPDDDKFNPNEWEVIEKALPDGTKKRYRRRIITSGIPAKKKKSNESIIEDSPMKIELSPIKWDEAFFSRDDDTPDKTEVTEMEILEDQEREVCEEPPILAEEPTLQLEEAPVDFEEPPGPMCLEEIEIDEENPMDTWYDPSEWEVVERILPDGTKKRYRVRMVESLAPPDDDSMVVVEEEPMEMEEVEVAESDPEDSKYDPKDWDVVEKTEPDGTKKRFRRRYIVTCVRTVPKKPSNPLIDEPPMQVEEVPIDESNPEDEKYDPAEWEVAETLAPDGQLKRVRRRIVITRICVESKKPSEINEDEPIAQVEEVDIDEANPEDDKYDPNEWEEGEKLLPDGKKKRVRRRVLITRVQFVSKNPRDITPDEPLAQIEEVDFDEANPEDEKYDPNEWELAEKTLPDGQKKKVRRRILVTRVEFVKRKPSDIPPEEPIAKVEEVDIDESIPLEEQLDPAEWELAEKTLPNGEKKRVRRRIVISRVQIVKKKPSELSPEEPVAQIEEVDLDEANPDDNKYDPNEWEVEEKTLPDGTKKPVLRRYIIKRLQTIVKKPSDIPVSEPLAKLEEVEVDEANPEDDKFDPNEWEIVEKISPEGKKRVHRRVVVTRVNFVNKKPSEISADEPLALLEEVDFDESNPEDEKYDPKEWELAEKVLPDGQKKLVRRRYIVKKRQLIYKKPSDISFEDPVAELEEVEIDEANPEDEKYDPTEWETAKKVMPDGSEVPVCRRYVIKKVQTIYKKPSDVPADDPDAQLEEVEVNDACPENMEYNPDEWEMGDKRMPDGTTVPVRRRIIISKRQTIYQKPSEVHPEETMAMVEEVDFDEATPEDDRYDPEEWEVGEKTLPDGSTKPVRRRYVIRKVVTEHKKPSDIPVDEPFVQVEEVDADEVAPGDNKFDPDEWHSAEKILPDGTKKPVKHRFNVKRVESAYLKPSEVPAEEPIAKVEEVDVDEANPEDEKYNPAEWEIMEKTLPDGTTKPVRRRYVINRVQIVHKKPSEIPADEPLARIEEVEVDEANPEDDKYDPAEWETVETTTPDGEKKRVRRRVIITRVLVENKKPSEIPIDEPMAQIEEVDFDESNPEDDKYNPNEWDLVEITTPDGEKKKVRRRCIIKNVKRAYLKPSDVPPEVPLAEVEEMDISEVYREDEQFDPSGWEVADKMLPDGTMKPVCRRFVLKKVTKVHIKPCDVPADEPIAQVEEVDFDEANPEDDKYDPNEWEIAEKILPDGTKKPVRRRYVISSRQTVFKKPTEVCEEPQAEIEEVEIDEANPEDEKYNPADWDIVEKDGDNGEKKRYRCRVVVTQVRFLYKKPSAVSPNEPHAQLEEVDVDEEHPENDKHYDPSEWEVVDKECPDGTKKKVRRRFLVTRVQTIHKKPSELSPDEPEGVSIEEVELDEPKPEDDKYDPAEWEVLDKCLPDGTKKKVRRRIVLKTVKTAHKSPPEAVDSPAVIAKEVPAIVEEGPILAEEAGVEESLCDEMFAALGLEEPKKKGGKVVRKRSIKTTISPMDGRSASISAEELRKPSEEIEIDEANPQDELYDPKEWEIIERTLPDGTKKRYRHKIVKTVITTCPQRHSDSANDDSLVELEEYEIDDSQPDESVFNQSECETLERTFSSGSTKKYTRRVVSSSLPTAAEGTELRPVYKEVEIDEANPEDDKYDPREWDLVERTMEDGTKKRFRRRKLKIITVNKKPIAITAGDAPLRVEEEEVDEAIEDKLDLSDWEVVEKTMPNGKKKKIYRRIVTTIFNSADKGANDNAPIHIEEDEVYEVSSGEEEKYDLPEWQTLDTTQPDGSVSKVRTRSSVTVITPKDTMKMKDKVVDEEPIAANEIHLDESAPADNSFNPEDWDVTEKTLPDGTVKRFHRRIVRVVKRLSTNEPGAFEEVPMEEIELDESNPEENEKYMKSPDWEITEKELPDGKKKRFRRRIVKIVKKIPENEKLDVGEIPIEVEEVEIDESNPEEEEMYNTPEWEIVEKQMPDGTVKRFRRKIITTVTTTVVTRTVIVLPDGTEQVIEEESSPGETSTVDGNIETVTENFMKNLVPEDEPVVQPLLEENLECALNTDMDNILKDLKRISRSLDEDEVRLSLSEEHQKKLKEEKAKHLEASLGDQSSKPDELEPINRLSEEEIKRMQEEERKRREDHNATIDSIFTLPDDDELLSSTRAKDSVFDDSITDTTFEDDYVFASADPDFTDSGCEGVVRTASVLKQPSAQQRSPEKDGNKVHSLDKRYLRRGETEPIPRTSSASSRLNPRILIESDGLRPRALSSAGLEQDDVYSHTEGGAEIVYTVKDVAAVEQGTGGFVQTMKAKHEEIASEELRDIRRNSAYLDDHVHIPKGHVPTHPVNFQDVEEPNTHVTKTPPAVTSKSTVIAPASSELPPDEFIYPATQLPVECHPDLQTDTSESMEIPEVKTRSVVFEEVSDDGVCVRDPAVETQTVQFLPVTESRTVQHETIHDISGSHETLDESGGCQITTYTLPTEVITQTITIEGDSSTMSPEELQEILRKAGSNENILDDPNSSSTHVTTTVQKVITGQTITVTGDDDEELQRVIDEAVKKAASTEALDVDDDKTIVLTAVQHYEEDDVDGTEI